MSNNYDTIPKSFISPKLAGAGMTPISRDEFLELIYAVKDAEDANIENLYLNEYSPGGGFLSEYIDTIISELELVERTYRYGSKCGETWYDQSKGPYLSVVTRVDFEKIYPEHLEDIYEISRPLALSLRDLAKVLIKNRARELAAIYEWDFVEEDKEEEDEI